MTKEEKKQIKDALIKDLEKKGLSGIKDKIVII